MLPYCCGAPGSTPVWSGVGVVCNLTSAQVPCCSIVLAFFFRVSLLGTLASLYLLNLLRSARTGRLHSQARLGLQQRWLHEL